MFVNRLVVVAFIGNLIGSCRAVPVRNIRITTHDDQSTVVSFKQTLNNRPIGHMFQQTNDTKGHIVQHTTDTKGQTKGSKNAIIDHSSDGNYDEFTIDQNKSETIIDYHRNELNIQNVNNSMNISDNNSLIKWGCDACKFIVGLIQVYTEQHRTEDEIASKVKEACIKLKIEDITVCTGIVKLFKLEVLTVLSRLALSTDELCGYAFGELCSTTYNPSGMWYIEFPAVPKPPVVPITPPKTGDPTLRVLHLTDIHLDLNYMQGAEVNCGEPLCCRKGDKVPAKTGAPVWGSFGNCDLPLITLENLLQHLNQTDKFDYIMMTGDLAAHYVWQSTKTDTEYLIKYFTKLFVTYFPGVPVYPSLGNHEAVPVNSFPPDWKVVPESEKTDWLYKVAATTWKNWLPQDTMATILRGGFYTTKIRPGFRIVSLNMNYCNNQNWWTLLNMTDPNGQLKWLIDVLQAAENNKEKVHIIGHIPPGNGDCVKAWSWNFYNIVNRYESTIIGQFYGHTHYDMFEVFYDPQSDFTRATSIAYVAPSVEAANSGNNGYKVYTVDGDHNQTTRMVIDHDNYVFNLADANAGKAPRWTKIYSAKAAYNMTSLLPTEWDKLIHKMAKDDTLIQKYYKYFYKGHPPSPTCDAGCRKSLLCQMKSGRSYDPNLCRGLNTTEYALYQDWERSVTC